MANPADGWTMYPRKWIETPSSNTVDKDKQFTLVTYNILCDKYIKNSFYEYCPKEIRYMDTRGPRILKEIQTMGADIFALQEVSREHYDEHLRKDITAMGYDMVVGTGGDLAVGQLTAWKKNVFIMLHHEEHMFADLAMEDKYIQEHIGSDEDKKKFLNWLDKNRMIVITQLEHIPSKSKLLIGNIHVSWTILKKPSLQALQIGLSMKLISRLAKELDTESIILCGDFNSPPDFPPYELLQNGFLSKDTVDGLASKSAENLAQQNVMQPDLERTMPSTLPEAYRSDVDLASAYRTVVGEEPSVTNSDNGDRELGIVELCLDYLWFNRGTLKVLATLETPPRDVVMKHTSLPSVLFPSDHLPLAFKMHFVKI